MADQAASLSCVAGVILPLSLGSVDQLQSVAVQEESKSHNGHLLKISGLEADFKRDSCVKHLYSVVLPAH